MSISHVDPHVEYPTGDGKPMAETPLHRDLLMATIERLRAWSKDRPDVYVSGNMFVYYVEGNRRKHVSPDVFLVLGVPATYREIYCTWAEPKPTLDLAIELTSKSTSDEDQREKMALYASELGVREYLLFDPYAEYLEPPEQLFRLVRGRYIPVDPVDGRLPSEVTGLHFERDGHDLLLWDPNTRKYMPTPREQAEFERQRADALAAEMARLQAELAALRRAEPPDVSD